MKKKTESELIAEALTKEETRKPKQPAKLKEQPCYILIATGVLPTIKLLQYGEPKSIIKSILAYNQKISYYYRIWITDLDGNVLDYHSPKKQFSIVSPINRIKLLTKPRFFGKAKTSIVYTNTDGDEFANKRTSVIEVKPIDVIAYGDSPSIVDSFTSKLLKGIVNGFINFCQGD